MNLFEEHIIFTLLLKNALPIDEVYHKICQLILQKKICEIEVVLTLPIKTKEADLILGLSKNYYVQFYNKYASFQL